MPKENPRTTEGQAYYDLDYLLAKLGFHWKQLHLFSRMVLVHSSRSVLIILKPS